MSSKKDIFVFAHWEGLSEPIQMGMLSTTPAKGKEVFSFEYTKDWLKSGFNHTIDPDLALSVAEIFRVEKIRANKIIAKIKDAVSGWRDVAKSIGLSRTEQDRMSKAFLPA